MVCFKRFGEMIGNTSIERASFLATCQRWFAILLLYKSVFCFLLYVDECLQEINIKELKYTILASGSGVTKGCPESAVSGCYDQRNTRRRLCIIPYLIVHSNV